MAKLETATEMVEIGGIGIELNRLGHGKPLLVLCSEDALEREAPFLQTLARDHALIIPSPPGFGASERPDWITSPDDIAYIYLDLVDRLGPERLDVVGFSFGGWIAAEMATKDDGFIAKLVLVDPYGIKIGGPADRDIADIWLLHPRKVMELSWFDPAKGQRDFPAMPEEVLKVVARSRESFARFCWEPYLHNPKLKHRLNRIKVPTLFVWGENDGITAPSYGKAYAGLVAGAKLAIIAQAGHYPHLEQPEKFLKELRGFLDN
jgi:pimeloyl-ACP methyl ester carboxylesterase